MNTQEEIFESFFSNLDEDDAIPDAVLAKLRDLFQDGLIGSKTDLLDAISLELEDANKG